MVYKLSFRIRREYFELIRKNEKLVEVRKASEFWLKRALRVQDMLNNIGGGVECVFLCGKEVLRRHLTKVKYYGSAEEALGRPPSEQGQKDCGSGGVFGFHFLPDNMNEQG